MNRLRARTSSAAAALLLAAGVLTGCSGGGDDADDPVAGASGAAGEAATGAGGAGATEDGTAAGRGAGDAPVVPGASRFVVLSSGSWFLSQGIKPIGDSVKQYLRDDKSFDWYAEYAEPDLDQSVRITGHLRGLAAQTAVLKKLGGKITSTQIAGRKAVWSAPPGAAPVTVLIELAPNYTISFEASGVEVQETLKLAAALKPANEAAWKKAGGRVIDCPPGGDECPN